MQEQRKRLSNSVRQTSSRTTLTGRSVTLLPRDDRFCQTRRSPVGREQRGTCRVRFERLGDLDLFGSFIGVHEHADMSEQHSIGRREHAEAAALPGAQRARQREHHLAGTGRQSSQSRPRAECHGSSRVPRPGRTEWRAVSRNDQ
jgi:hypothetical protein